MTIAVKRYTSNMTNAPNLTGIAGSLVGLLDACLINGFNSKTVTLAQTNGTATATCSSHGFAVNDVVELSGANETGWNDEFRVLTADTNTFTFAIAAATPSPATGTITAKIAPLGWTKPFSGTNKAVYLPQFIYCQNYLRILDDSTVPSSNGRWAKARGYETMTDVDTGTNLFPTTVQSTNGLSIMKSNQSNSTTRIWWLVGDGGIFYLGVAWHDYYQNDASTGLLMGGYCFGDINSTSDVDLYATMICGEETETFNGVGSYNKFIVLGTYNNAQSGKYLPRSYTQTGTSVAAGMMGDHGVSDYFGNGGFAYPHPTDNALLFSTVSVVESNILRSRALPGLYQPLHTKPFDCFALITDIPDLPGKTLQAFNLCTPTAGNRAQCFIDITGPWR